MLKSGGLFPLYRFEILDGGGAAQVEQIGADTEVPSAAALALTDMSQLVFDRHSGTQAFASFGGGDALS